MATTHAQFVVSVEVKGDKVDADWNAIESALKSALIQSVIVDNVVIRETGDAKFVVDVKHEDTFAI